MAESVPVTGPDGTAQLIAIRDLLIKSLVRNAVKAKPKDQLLILERLAKLNVLAPTEEEQEPDEDIFTEEHRFIMERLQRDFPVIFYQCEKSVQGDSQQHPMRGDFGFG